MRCARCGWLQTFSSRLVRRGKSVGVCVRGHLAKFVLYSLVLACSGCTVVSANRVFPKMAWYWSRDAKLEREYRKLNLEYHKSLKTNETNPP